MGALMENADDDIEDAIVLTDLMGIEDALGMMDFKVRWRAPFYIFNDRSNVRYYFDAGCGEQGRH